jgi:hypothetical protein
LLPPEFAQQLRIDELEQERFGFSLLWFAEGAINLWIVYGLGLVAILLMIVGLFSRVTTIAAFLFVLSFVHRTPMMARPVDFVLTMLMFYLCIGPSGAYFSIDAILRRRKRQATTDVPEQREQLFSSAATVAIRLMQVHLALIFFAMAMAQLREEAWWQGTAVWWMMAKSDSRLIDLTGMNGALNNMGLARAFEYLVNFSTHLIVLYEFSFAILIWNALARPMLLVLGAFIWFGIALVSGYVSFAVLMFVATLAFLSPERLHGWCTRFSRERVPAGGMVVAAA